MLIVNDASEAHLRNLARALNRSNKPYEKLGGSCSLSELQKIEDLSKAEKDSINHDMREEVYQLLNELGIDIKDYPDGYENWEPVGLYDIKQAKKKVIKQLKEEIKIRRK